jgi:hypothetical protein
MTNERKIWITAAIIWTAIVASIAAPAQPRPVEVACVGTQAAN